MSRYLAITKEIIEVMDKLCADLEKHRRKTMDKRTASVFELLILNCQISKKDGLDARNKLRVFLDKTHRKAAMTKLCTDAEKELIKIRMDKICADAEKQLMKNAIDKKEMKRYIQSVDPKHPSWILARTNKV